MLSSRKHLEIVKVSDYDHQSIQSYKQLPNLLDNDCVKYLSVQPPTQSQKSFIDRVPSNSILKFFKEL